MCDMKNWGKLNRCSIKLFHYTNISWYFPAKQKRHYGCRNLMGSWNVVSHVLFWSCVGLNELLSDYGTRQCNFKWISFKQTNYIYNVFYGFAPYYKQNVMSAIDLLPFYCILHDERLNEILHWDQLDIHIRVLGAKNQEAITGICFKSLSVFGLQRILHS